MVLDNISWGEIFIISGMAITLIGRKDLPAASHTLGRQVGRVVGLLMGARQRLDKFAANNELKQLQNELRMGLRELDAIKTELVVASSTGLMGRELGSTLGRQVIRPNSTSTGFNPTAATGATSAISGAAINTTTNPTMSLSSLTTKNIATKGFSPLTQLSSEPTTSPHTKEIAHELAPREHSVAAVAEEEWQKRGIGFKSRAEMGTFGTWASNPSNSPVSSTNYAPQSMSGGATILADLIQQNLIYDQYERVTREQQEMLQSKADNFRKNQEEAAKNETK